LRASPVTLQSSHLTACPWPAHRRQMHTRGQICRRDPFCARHRLARIEGYAAFDRLPERWRPSREPSHSTLTKMPFTQREDLGHSSIDLTGPYVCPRLTRVSEGDWPVPNHLLSRFRRPPDPLVRWRTRFGQVLACHSPERPRCLPMANERRLQQIPDLGTRLPRIERGGHPRPESAWRKS